MRDANATPVVVLDSNLIVSGAISPHGLSNQAPRAFQRGAYTLICSQDLADEIADVLTRDSIRGRFQTDPVIVESILAALRAATVRPLTIGALPVHCRDPRDVKVLARTLGGGADFLVTGDADLLSLDRHPGLGSPRILTPRAFLEALTEA
jgi:putative PIN family toxin of toxin-antitoxin system